MEHDWSESITRLYDAASVAIKMFAEENPSVELCCFYFDCDDPQYGRISISFDSLENNIRSVNSLENFAIENRKETLLKGDLNWKWAKYQLSSPALSPFNTNSGDFEYQEYHEVGFPAWCDLAKSKEYPQSDEHEDDYLESNARIVMWRVAERLIDNDAFSGLTLVSPFIIGYSIHDQEEVILRLLNWPKEA